MVFIIFRRGDSRIARFMLFSSIKRTAEDVGPYKKHANSVGTDLPGGPFFHQTILKLEFSIYFFADMCYNQIDE